MVKKIIFIDPGHGGKDSGAVNGVRHEADDNLRLSLLIKSELEKQDVEVLLSRTADKFYEINERTAMANKAKADYFLSVHRNDAKGSTATGNEIWVLDAAQQSTWDKANRILTAVCAVDGLINRGTKRGAPSYSNFGVNKYTDMPSALIEMGFISNTADNTAYDKHINEYARVIAKALCENVGVRYIEPVTKGDLNGDGKITPADARTALRGAVGIEPLTNEQKTAADMNNDGKVTASDARNILRKSVGIE